MKKIAILVVVAIVGFQGVAEPEKSFAMSSLVLPQGVSYTLGPVTLTRELETATSTSKLGTTSLERGSEESGTKKAVGTSTGSESSSRFDSGASFGGSIGGNSGGTGGFSLLGLLGVNMNVGGKISNEDINTSNSSSRNSSETSYGKSYQKENGSSSELSEIEQYGCYHLKFTVVFKSKDLTDTFLVGGPNSRVILNGFSSPVPVPYLERQEPVRLRAEERVFFFDYPIADQLLLKDAKRFASEGRRNAVTLALTGDEFPVVSERTKENVVSEITRLMNQSPNSVISVAFGDIKRLSPWRVRQRFPRSSGLRGRRVTVREAFDALNGAIASDEDMPEEAFMFDKSGQMTEVCNLSTVGSPIRGDLSLVAISAVENTESAETIVRLPTADFMSRPLSDFAELHLVRLSLQEVAQANAVRHQQVSLLVDECLAAIGSVHGGKELWEKLMGEYKLGGKNEDNPAEDLSRRMQNIQEDNVRNKAREKGPEPQDSPVELVIYGYGPLPLTSETFDVYANNDHIGTVTRNSVLRTVIKEDTEFRFERRGWFRNQCYYTVQKKYPTNIKLQQGFTGWEVKPVR